nr:hypothetical protein [Propionibacterium sp.]
MKCPRLAAAVACLATGSLLAGCSAPADPGPSASAASGVSAASGAPAASVTIAIGTPRASGTPTPTTAPPPPTAAEVAAAEALLARHGLAGRSVEEVVGALAASTEKRPLTLQAVVKPWVLELSDGTTKGALPLPADRFYLAVAPYRNGNPPCSFHNLSADQGELPNFAFHVVVADANNTPLVDADVTTGPNGFVGFWLPRDRQGLITGTVEGAAGQVGYSTRGTSPTCRFQLPLRPYRR